MLIKNPSEFLVFMCINVPTVASGTYLAVGLAFPAPRTNVPTVLPNINITYKDMYRAADTYPKCWTSPSVLI